MLFVSKLSASMTRIQWLLSWIQQNMCFLIWLETVWWNAMIEYSYVKDSPMKKIRIMFGVCNFTFFPDPYQVWPWSALGASQPTHGSWKCIKRKKIAYGKIFYLSAQKCIWNWIPRDQNSPLRGFWVRALFLTFPHEKTTFQWSKVVSEAIFPTN